MIYVPWVPCADCARAIIQVGIVTVVTDNISVPERWRESFEASLEMLEEAKVRIRLSNSDCFLSRHDILGAAAQTPPPGPDG
jgi:dCMP deaminase